jgi:formylmethanofuran dehydrogenase subunit E-like metal-binding protein
MKPTFVSTMIAGFLSITTLWIFAVENSGAAMEEPASAEMIAGVKEHLVMLTDKNGNINVEDPTSHANRTLEYIKVNDTVRKNGDTYSICVDFVDRNGGDKVNIDYDFQQQEDGSIKVTQSSVHKINDEEFYTYDAQNNRMPKAP